MRSKGDPRSPDGVLVARLTFLNSKLMPFLLESEVLAECRARVVATGCDLMPSWANSALLLVPLTRAQVDEAGLELKPHNIVMLAADYHLTVEALSELPRRRRPQLKPESQADPAESACADITTIQEYEMAAVLPEQMAHADDVADDCVADAAGMPDVLQAQDVEHLDVAECFPYHIEAFGLGIRQDPMLIIERTFLSLPLEKDISEVSVPMQSAPAVNEHPPNHVNPHRWHLPNHEHGYF